MLEHNLDSLSIAPAADARPPLNHPNIRGSEYYGAGGEPTRQGELELC